MKHLNALTTRSHSAALEAMVTTVAMESFNLADLANKGTGFLAQLVDTGSKTIEQALTAFKGFTFKKESVENFNDYDKASKYNEVMRLRVPCPEGFQGNIPQYAAVLNDAVDQALRVYSEVLIPLEQFLSQLVSVPGFARDTRNHLKFLTARTPRQSYDEAIKPFFNGSTKADAPFGELYKNMNEWHTSYASVKEMQGRVDSINRDEILAKIASISKTITMLKESHEAKELENMSKVVISEIARGVYEAAKQVEQLSLTTFSVYVLANNMNETASKI